MGTTPFDGTDPADRRPMSVDEIRDSYADWADWADRFDWLDRTVTGRYRRELFGDARGRVLDVACGTGTNFPSLPPEVDLVGIDVSPAMLANARERLERLEVDGTLYEMDAQALAFDDDSFDTVVSSFSTCTFPDPVTALVRFRHGFSVRPEPAGRNRRLTGSNRSTGSSSSYSLTRIGVWKEVVVRSNDLRPDPNGVEVFLAQHPHRYEERETRAVGGRIGVAFPDTIDHLRSRGTRVQLSVHHRYRQLVLGGVPEPFFDDRFCRDGRMVRVIVGGVERERLSIPLFPVFGYRDANLHRFRAPILDFDSTECEFGSGSTGTSRENQWSRSDRREEFPAVHNWWPFIEHNLLV
ncbi:class I SAM-dependent methyltransferase [Natronobeatus ordinarius]|uniref:class I SAM-dependent methyltransferase n=1 Tax=Natronobeatus ordinarius TaxID=2963433 RepID=UPI0020CCBC44|nr:class I SAM-dependent methyltransferase [Natronobeatus ordinarius]